MIVRVVDKCIALVYYTQCGASHCPGHVSQVVCACLSACDAIYRIYVRFDKLRLRWHVAARGERSTTMHWFRRIIVK